MEILLLLSPEFSSNNKVYERIYYLPNPFICFVFIETLFICAINTYKLD